MSGLARYGTPEKAIKPDAVIGPFADEILEHRTGDAKARALLVRPPMSSDIMDQDKSSTSMMSTPLAWVSVRSLAKRGPASATMHRADREQPQKNQQSSRRRPGGAARRARNVRAGETQSAENLPARPRKNA